MVPGAWYSTTPAMVSPRRTECNTVCPTCVAPAAKPEADAGGAAAPDGAVPELTPTANRAVIAAEKASRPIIVSQPPTEAYYSLNAILPIMSRFRWIVSARRSGYTDAQGGNIDDRRTQNQAHYPGCGHRH